MKRSSSSRLSRAEARVLADEMARIREYSPSFDEQRFAAHERFFVDDVRRFYEAKVPMGRGCLPSDIAKAVYYLVEQHYETGQALPVTGGQVMLH